MDPSLRHTGYLVVELGKLPAEDRVLVHGTVNTERSVAKRSVRAADDTAESVRSLVRALLGFVREHGVRAIAAELPTCGGKSARAVASMAIALASCAALVEFTGLPAEWVTPTENKKRLAGSKNAGKDEMEAAAAKVFPEVAEMYRHAKGQYAGQLSGDFEHVADAIGVYISVREGTIASTLRQII